MQTQCDVTDGYRAEHMIFVNIVRLSLTLAVQPENNKKRRQKRFTRFSMRREQAANKKR